MNNLSSPPPINQITTLPLGISFFTFKAVSLIVDTYRGNISLDGNFLNGVTYLSFFAHIQSGPISRYTDKGWIDGNPVLTWDNLSKGVSRFAIGLSKKVIIADSLLKIVNNAFSTAPENLSLSFAWLGAVCYSLQLFFDFSGYSDMAIGISNMFGFSCSENFNYPYMTQSISEFWRKWHMSLGSWFRDYIYIPLGGSRVNNKLRLYFNLFVVWLLTGLWHGANWTFIIWGLIYFVLISLEKTLNLPNIMHHPVSRLIYRLICLVVIIFLWVLFRSPTVTYGLQYIQAMVVPHAVPIADKRALFLLKDNAAFILMGLILCFPIIPRLEKRFMNNRQFYSLWSILLSVIIVLGFLWSVSFVITNTNNPFLYANF